MGDPVLDKLFTGFGFIFGPVLILSILFGWCIVSWVAATIVHHVWDGFKLANQKVVPPVTDDTARQEVLKIRAMQDEARLRRVTRRAAIKRDIANHVVSENDDLMAEMVAMQVEPEPRVLLCKNPLSERPEYFIDVLAGRAIGEGAKGLRAAKVYYTPLRNHGRAMPESEARKWLAHLPDAKNLFVVPVAEPSLSPRPVARPLARPLYGEPINESHHESSR